MKSPDIVYGTAWKRERTEELVRLAIGCGFRGIDTAGQPKHYNEAAVGTAVAACLGTSLKRTEIYLQTKFTPAAGQDPRRMPYDPGTAPPVQVAQSFAASLANLQTSYVDGFLLHSPLASDALTLAVWRAMETQAEAGKALALGISNCYELARLEALCDQARIAPAVLQNRFYAATGYDREIRAFCRDRRIIYQGFWTLTANPEVLSHPTFTALAKRLGRTPAQVLYRFLTQSGVVPLTGTQSHAHMREDLAVFEFELTVADCRDINRAFADKNAGLAPAPPA
ncbi:MAG: aldo/keto reductase family protein [Steroidobacteraceae bacterium]